MVGTIICRDAKTFTLIINNLIVIQLEVFTNRTCSAPFRYSLTIAATRPAIVCVPLVPVVLLVPLAAIFWPAMQSVHTVQENALATAEYVPAPQGAHTRPAIC